MTLLPEQNQAGVSLSLGLNLLLVAGWFRVARPPLLLGGFQATTHASRGRLGNLGTLATEPRPPIRLPTLAHTEQVQVLPHRYQRQPGARRSLWFPGKRPGRQPGARRLQGSEAAPPGTSHRAQCYIPTKGRVA